MSSWDDLYDLVRQAERALFHLKLDQSIPKWEVLREEAAGWYSRGYLVPRLPAEIARSRKTGRPFGIALVRVSDSDELVADQWRSFLTQHLDPIEVAIAYGERELCLLFPEHDRASTRSRLIELVDAAKVAGLITYASTEVSFLSYPEVQKLPGALLADLEESLKPLAALTSETNHDTDFDTEHDAVIGADNETDVGVALDPEHDVDHNSDRGADQDTNRVNDRRADHGTDDRGERTERKTATEEAKEPVAVGFAADRTLPVSFWFQGELYTIQAVLEDEREDQGGQRLMVLTESGHFRLERAGERWYAQKVD